jgi:nicotinamidase/pyrazinamidase
LKALILIDLQNDFMPWGSVGIEKSNEIIPLANQIMEHFNLVVASQDWHPADHKSFAANHPWRMPGQVIDLHGIPQLLWTMHCVQHSFGAELVNGLNANRISKIFQKGVNSGVDSYSIFFENDHKNSSGLEDYLKSHKVKEIFIMGLTTDFGVKYSALDAVQLGFKTNVIIDGCQWFDLENVEKTLNELKIENIQIINADDLRY